MKLFLSIFALIWSFNGFTTTITVSNLVTSPAQYNNLQAAINAAQPNDTIQVYGSDVPYGGTYGEPIITKPLHFIGSGFVSKLRAIIGIVSVLPESTGSTFAGFKIGMISPKSPGNYRNYLFEFCEIDAFEFGYIWSNVIIKNCVINQSIIRLGDDDGILISNNIITVNSPNNPNNFFIDNYISTSQPSALPVIIQNNLFLADLNIRGSNISFINNVFANTSGSLIPQYYGIPSSCWDCIFQNNLSYCATCDLDSIVGVVLRNNLENQSNPFVSSAPNYTDADFNLNTSSAGNNYGTDGTDVGIFGGPFPFPLGSKYGGLLLGLPVVTFFSILNPVIPQNGELQIQGTSTIPTDN